MKELTPSPEPETEKIGNTELKRQLRDMTTQRDEATSQRDDVTFQRDMAWSQVREMGDVLKSACDERAQLIKVVRKVDSAVKGSPEALKVISFLPVDLPDVKAIKDSSANLFFRFEVVKVMGRKKAAEDETVDDEQAS